MPAFDLLSLSLWAYAALTGGEWAALLVAVAGSGGIASVASSIVAIKRSKGEDQRGDRTVAAEEAEGALRMMGTNLAYIQTELNEKRVEIAKQRKWRDDHTRICPLLRINPDL